MSDRAAVTLTDIDMVDEQREAFFATLYEQELDVADVDEEFEGTYQWFEEPLGILSAALALAERFPSASWTLRQDPKFEFAGEYYRHKAGVGLWIGECDAEGNPYVRADIIHAALAANPNELAATLVELSGARFV